jgi:hypothetical protein
MTEVATQHMSERDARQLTERIRLTARNLMDAKEKLLRLVDEAKAGNAHRVLGYESWPAYLADTLGDEPMRLARDDRKDMVLSLSERGMASRSIAPIVGASARQVRRDIAGGTNVPPDVQGMDGKTYARPEAQTAPKPEPEQDVAKDLDIINDIRLYFKAIASSRQIAGLTPKGKQHIIDAATNLINELQRNQ